MGDDQEYRERTFTELFGVFLVDVTLEVTHKVGRDAPLAAFVYEVESSTVRH